MDALQAALHKSRNRQGRYLIAAEQDSESFSATRPEQVFSEWISNFEKECGTLEGHVAAAEGRLKEIEMLTEPLGLPNQLVAVAALDALQLLAPAFRQHRPLINRVHALLERCMYADDADEPTVADRHYRRMYFQKCEDLEAEVQKRRDAMADLQAQEPSSRWFRSMPHADKLAMLRRVFTFTAPFSKDIQSEAYNSLPPDKLSAALDLTVELLTGSGQGQGDDDQSDEEDALVEYTRKGRRGAVSARGGSQPYSESNEDIFPARKFLAEALAEDRRGEGDGEDGEKSDEDDEEDVRPTTLLEEVEALTAHLKDAQEKVKKLTASDAQHRREIAFMRKRLVRTVDGENLEDELRESRRNERRMLEVIHLLESENSSLRETQKSGDGRLDRMFDELYQQHSAQLRLIGNLQEKLHRQETAEVYRDAEQLGDSAMLAADNDETPEQVQERVKAAARSEAKRREADEDSRRLINDITAKLEASLNKAEAERLAEEKRREEKRRKKAAQLRRRSLARTVAGVVAMTKLGSPTAAAAPPTPTNFDVDDDDDDSDDDDGGGELAVTGGAAAAANAINPLFQSGQFADRVRRLRDAESATGGLDLKTLPASVRRLMKRASFSADHISGISSKGEVMAFVATLVNEVHEYQGEYDELLGAEDHVHAFYGPTRRQRAALQFDSLADVCFLHFLEASREPHEASSRLAALTAALERELMHRSHRRVQLFARVLGLGQQPLNPLSVVVYLHAMKRLAALSDRGMVPAGEGWELPLKAMQGVAPVICRDWRPSSQRSVIDKLNLLGQHQRGRRVSPKRRAQQAASAPVSVDAFVSLLLDEWALEYEAYMVHLEHVFVAADSKGLGQLHSTEFAALVRFLEPRVGNAEMFEMLVETVKESPGEDMAPAGFAAVCRRHGLLASLWSKRQRLMERYLQASEEIPSSQLRHALVSAWQVQRPFYDVVLEDVRTKNEDCKEPGDSCLGCLNERIRYFEETLNNKDMSVEVAWYAFCLMSQAMPESFYKAGVSASAADAIRVRAPGSKALGAPVLQPPAEGGQHRRRSTLLTSGRRMSLRR